MRRRIIVGVILVIVAVGAFFGIRQLQSAQAAQSSTYQTVSVDQGDLTAIVGATGTVRSNQMTLLNWQITGRIGKINVQEGDVIKQGDVLAELEQSSLPQAVILARADLVTAQRNLDSLKNSALAQAQAQLALAQAEKAYQDAKDNRYNTYGGRGSVNSIDAARAQLVLANDTVKKAQEYFDNKSNLSPDDPVYANAQSRLAKAKQDRDAAQRNLDWLLAQPKDYELSQADANLSVAEARLKDAQREWDRLKNGPDPSDISAAEARVEALQTTLNSTTITAPFDATVTDVKSLVGDQVTPATISFRIDDLTHLLVDVLVPEVDINRIQVDQPATLSFDAIQGKEYDGKVVKVGKVGVVSQGVVNFTVTIELTNGDGDVRPGMTAAVNIKVNQLKNVVLIPNRAVRLRQGKRVVWLLSNNSPTPVEITLGPSSQDFSQLLKGDLKVGDKLVLNPPLEFSTSGPPGVSGGIR